MTKQLAMAVAMTTALTGFAPSAYAESAGLAPLPLAAVGASTKGLLSDNVLNSTAMSEAGAEAETKPEAEADAGDANDVDPTVTSSVRSSAKAKATATNSADAKAGARQGRSPYDAIITKYAAQHDVPVALAHAVVRVESNYRADARGAAGEVGLMQIKPSTARAMGYSGSAKGLYNPDTNIRFGMKYLAKARQLGGGDTCGTILRYNAGHGAKRMNPISASYCAKVKRFLTDS